MILHYTFELIKVGEIEESSKKKNGNTLAQDFYDKHKTKKVFKYFNK